MKQPISRLVLGAGALAALLLWLTPAAGQVGFGPSWFENDGPITIWVTIRARRGETVWAACRRVYQRDVYQAVRQGNGRVRCRIDHSRIYDPGNVRQNFNRR